MQKLNLCTLNIDEVNCADDWRRVLLDRDWTPLRYLRLCTAITIAQIYVGLVTLELSF